MTGEARRAVFVDGIYPARDTCALIARSGERVLGWYVAKSENSRAHKAPVARIAPPDVVVTDGGSGLQRVGRRPWPNARAQRCALHAFEQARRHTTTRPGTQAGVDPCALARKLLRAGSSGQAAAWLAACARRCSDYDEFLREETTGDGGRTFLTHERLAKARSSLTALVRQNALLTCVDPGLTERPGALPATNNAVESTNGQLRHMPREHRGLSLGRRIKAACWWRHMHTERPTSAAEVPKAMPADRSIAKEMRGVGYETGASPGPQRWGDGLAWEKLRGSTPWRRDWD